MKRNLSILFVAAFFIPAQLHAQGEAKKEPAKKIVVPFELIKTQHMVVSIKVNGKGPYRLVFDTGAPDSLVSGKLATEAQVFPKNFKKPLLAIFGNLGQVKIKEIELGELKAENISATVMDHPTLKAISSVTGPLDGILGFTFYARYKMSIDYEKKLMTFEPSEYVPSNMIEAIMEKMMASKSEVRVLAPAGILGLKVEKAKGDEAAGVTVKDVMPGTAAASAGIKVGDRLLTLDGRWTDTVADTYAAAGQVRPGTAATAQVLRGSEKLKLKVMVRAGL
jgi:hypothetical protein